MDPITLATITSAVSVLATEVVKGSAGEVGKEVWARVKSALGWREDPALDRIAPEVAQRFATDESMARTVVELLQQHANQVGTSGAIVGNVHAERLVVIQNQHISGDFNLDMGA
jgi:hypothetical protein